MLNNTNSEVYTTEILNTNPGKSLNDLPNSDLVKVFAFTPLTIKDQTNLNATNKRFYFSLNYLINRANNAINANEAQTILRLLIDSLKIKLFHMPDLITNQYERDKAYNFLEILNASFNTKFASSISKVILSELFTLQAGFKLRLGIADKNDSNHLIMRFTLPFAQDTAVVALMPLLKNHFETFFKYVFTKYRFLKDKKEFLIIGRVINKIFNSTQQNQILDFILETARGNSYYQRESTNNLLHTLKALFDNPEMLSKFFDNQDNFDNLLLDEYVDEEIYLDFIKAYNALDPIVCQRRYIEYFLQTINIDNDTISNIDLRKISIVSQIYPNLIPDRFIQALQVSLTERIDKNKINILIHLSKNNNLIKNWLINYIQQTYSSRGYYSEDFAIFPTLPIEARQIIINQLLNNLNFISEGDFTLTFLEENAQRMSDTVNFLCCALHYTFDLSNDWIMQSIEYAFTILNKLQNIDNFEMIMAYSTFLSELMKFVTDNYKFLFTSEHIKNLFQLLESISNPGLITTILILMKNAPQLFKSFPNVFEGMNTNYINLIIDNWQLYLEERLLDVDMDLLINFISTNISIIDANQLSLLNNQIKFLSPLGCFFLANILFTIMELKPELANENTINSFEICFKKALNSNYFNSLISTMQNSHICNTKRIVQLLILHSVNHIQSNKRRHHFRILKELLSKDIEASILEEIKDHYLHIILEKIKNNPYSTKELDLFVLYSLIKHFPDLLENQEINQTTNYLLNDRTFHLDALEPLLFPAHELLLRRMYASVDPNDSLIELEKEIQTIDQSSDEEFKEDEIANDQTNNFIPTAREDYSPRFFDAPQNLRIQHNNTQTTAQSSCCVIL